MDQILLQRAIDGDKRSIARCISLLENEVLDLKEWGSCLERNKSIPVVGIT
ncbi:MAG: hypothetical protein RL131_1468, partial [Bacteroidota bacterium]